MSYAEPASPTATKANIGEVSESELTDRVQSSAGRIESALALNRAVAAAGLPDGPCSRSP